MPIPIQPGRYNTKEAIKLTARLTHLWLRTISFSEKIWLPGTFSERLTRNSCAASLWLWADRELDFQQRVFTLRIILLRYGLHNLKQDLHINAKSQIRIAVFCVMRKYAQFFRKPVCLSRFSTDAEISSSSSSKFNRFKRWLKSHHTAPTLWSC